MAHFGLQPDECLIVEDNEHGIRAAKASGAHLLVVKEVTDTNITNILNRSPRSSPPLPLELQHEH